MGKIKKKKVKKWLTGEGIYGKIRVRKLIKFLEFKLEVVIGAGEKRKKSRRVGKRDGEIGQES